ncbi:uncharacterized protein LOC101238613 [Trichonephila clavipes]|uniref:Uncharacterized protein LOC101238613, partial n=1 Tax=Trichonephila clavipes TaxID=2585209 RepID=A0A8X6V861_TRICX|nr:uncharacterized protein LOC101238613 [Trichonephila clavipes]
MEFVRAYRISERSNVRNVQYNEYYGDGDSEGYESVKNFYGINTVTKLECIGHVQKRNYYGIVIRSNVGNLQKMMSSVIAAFFHCVSEKNNSLHGQCPEGSESWCRYQRAKAAGSPLKEIEQGLPNKIINQIKPTYLKLCNETLLKKCLHVIRDLGILNIGKATEAISESALTPPNYHTTPMGRQSHYRPNEHQNGIFSGSGAQTRYSTTPTMSSQL